MNTRFHGTQVEGLWRRMGGISVRLALGLILAAAVAGSAFYLAKGRQQIANAREASAVQALRSVESAPDGHTARTFGAAPPKAGALMEQSRESDRSEVTVDPNWERGEDVILDLSTGTVIKAGVQKTLPDARAVVVDAGGGYVRIKGKHSDTNFTYRVTGATSGTLAVEGVAATYSFRNIGQRTNETESPVSVVGGAGNDVLTVRIDGIKTTDNYLFFDGGLGNDTLVTAGIPSTKWVDETYSPGPGDTEGRVQIASLDGAPMMTVDFKGLEPVIDLVPGALTVNATDGNNAITYTQGSVAVNGKVSVDSFETFEFSNKTSLTLNGQNGIDTIVLANASTPTSLTAITVNGGEGSDWIDARSLAGPSITLNGNGGGDTLLGGGTADTLNGGDGDDLLYSGMASSTIDGGPNSDSVIYTGTVATDTIAFRQASVTSLQITINGSSQTDTVTTVEQVCIDPWDGDDAVTVTHADSLLVGTIPGMPVLVTGGSPEASDSLTVVDDGIEDLTILRRGADGQSGSVVVGPSTATGPSSPVNFEGIEDVSIQGTYVEFPFDAYENNDLAALATVLGSGGTVYACIDPTADADVFKVIPAQTGLMSLRVLYKSYGTMSSGRPGLPGNGTLQYGVTDANDNLIATAPAHVLVVAGQTYLVRVTGTSGSVNAYSLVAGNTGLPVPSGVSIDPAGETATSNPRPRFIVHADLNALSSAGATILTPALASGGVTPGVAVLVTITDTNSGAVVQGYAAAIGSSKSEFEFTPAADLTPGAYTVAASVKLYDGQTTHASGQSTLSVPLDLTVMSCDGLPVAGDSITFGPVPVAAFVSASDGMYAGRVRVSWPEVPGASEYLVYRASMPDLSDAKLLGQVTQNLFLDDYSARLVQSGGGGCSPSTLLPQTYYYQVFSSGPCIATLEIGRDEGSAGINDAVAQYALPAETDLLGFQLISQLSSISVQIRGGAFGINSNQVWGVIYADSPLNAANVSIGTSAKVTGQSLWVTYTPAVPWQLGEIVTMIVGATDTGGHAIAPITCAFKVNSAKQLEWATESLPAPPNAEGYATAVVAPVAQTERLPKLDGAVGEAYAILPEGPYEEPAWVWLPLPPACDPAAVEVAYLYFDGDQTRWLPGREILGWLADEEARIASLDGKTYVGYLVTHSGTVCLAMADDVGRVQQAGLLTTTSPSPLRGVCTLIPLGLALMVTAMMRRIYRKDEELK